MNSTLNDTLNSRPMLGASCSLLRGTLRSSSSQEACKQTPGQRERLAQAGYPRFVFRLASSQRNWEAAPGAPRRHD